MSIEKTRDVKKVEKDKRVKEFPGIKEEDNTQNVGEKKIEEKTIDQNLLKRWQELKIYFEEYLELRKVFIGVVITEAGLASIAMGGLIAIARVGSATPPLFPIALGAAISITGATVLVMGVYEIFKGIREYLKDKKELKELEKTLKEKGFKLG